MARGLTFNDPRVIKILKERFVAVAQDCDYTERRQTDDKVKRFWSRVIHQREEGKQQDGGPDQVQGYYTFDSTGQLYGALSYIQVEHDTEVLLRLLRETLAAHGKREVPKGVQDGEERPTYPKVPDDVRVLQVYSRVLPLPEKVNDQNARLGRDYMWIRKSEIEALTHGHVTPVLTMRIALSHLRDNVRGEPRTYHPDHLEKAEFEAEVTERTDTHVRVRIGGTFRISAPRGDAGFGKVLDPMGYEGTLEGELVVDAKTGEPTRFVMYADGKAWGEFTPAPGAPSGKFPLKIAFVLAPKSDRRARIIPPFAAAGNVKAYIEEGRATKMWGNEGN